MDAIRVLGRAPFYLVGVMCYGIYSIIALVPAWIAAYLMTSQFMPFARDQRKIAEISKGHDLQPMEPANTHLVQLLALYAAGFDKLNAWLLHGKGSSGRSPAPRR